MNMPRIRPLALCIFHHQGKILVHQFHDKVAGRTIFRPVGGGIEFGETSHEAIVREVREELDAAVTDLHLIGTLENIFVWQGLPGHELVRVFDGRFEDSRLYDRDYLDGREDDGTAFTVRWLGRESFNGDVVLAPDGLGALLEGMGLLR